MTTETTNILALPDETQFRQDIQAINRFQQVVHTCMVKGHDYGTIPGTQKPTLLKPGAEKIAKLLGLSDQYEIVDRQEHWEPGRAFFRYLVRCTLKSVSHGTVISEGLGECNSMESRYRWRWVYEKDIPAGVEKDSLVKQTRNGRNGQYTMYRMENEDIYSQVNTILKMAKKRALVDAALSAGRLSEVFTQDIEDLADEGVIDSTASEVKPEAKPQDDMITDPQKRKIKASMREHGIPDELVKNYMFDNFGVEHSKDMTKKQASELIQAIETGNMTRPES